MFKLKPDIKKIEMAIILIVIGISLRAVLAPYANIEPVIAISLLAGVILGGYYAFFVPLTIMILSDWVVYMLGYGMGFGLITILGISLFTWSGMVFAGIIGSRMKPIFLYRMKTVAVFTGVGIMVTLLYDAWTMFGYILVMKVPIGQTLVLQISFTIRHLFSTLIFVPLLTTIYIYIHEYGIPSILPFKRNTKAPDKDKG